MVRNQRSFRVDPAVKLCKYRFAILAVGGVLKQKLTTLRCIHSDD